MVTASESLSRRTLVAISIRALFKARSTSRYGPLSQAAQSCFGSDAWPDNILVPQGWLEFEIENVEKATADLESREYQMLIRNKTEPWGQTVSRFLSPEGLLVAVTFTPSLREQK
jgi:hypothetical protein